MKTAGQIRGFDRWHDVDFIRSWDARPSSLLRREQLDILATVVTSAWRRGERILDLGCGTGKLEQLLLKHLPRARFTAVDRSPAMLELAREKLRRHTGQVRFTEQNLARLDRAALPGRPFRFIVSVNVVHELSHAAKRRLFRACRGIIARTGIMLVVDRVAIDRQRLRLPYTAVLERLQRLNGEASGELSPDFANPRSPDHEQPATIEQYLRWLRAAGFTPGVLHQHFHKVLLAAVPAN